MLPDRVDDALLAWLRALPWPVTIVVHANHANEFDVHVDAALARLRGAGAMLLNQAVLLRGVNDSVDALADLGERGHAAGVLPYYLHQLDRVQGAAHFEVDDARARALQLSWMLHVGAIVALGAILWGLRPATATSAWAIAACGCLATAAVLLVLEQRWAEDVNLAFFKTNVWVGFAVLAMVLCARATSGF